MPEQYSTIQAAIDAASNNDIVLVSEGTYYEGLICNKNITITSSDGPDNTIINSNNYAFDINNASPIINGFTVTGNTEGIHMDGNGSGPNPSPIISNMKFINCNSSYGALIGGYEAGSPIIEKSLFINNHTAGSLMGGFGESTGVLTIENCTILNNNVESYLFGFGSASSGHKLKNSIVRNNGAQIINGGISVSYTNIQGWSGGSNNIDSDPLFNGDYTLQPSSPCIDAGDPNSEYDPDGTRADMGAYYFHQEQDVYGCTDPEASNYDPDATVDDGSCCIELWGECYNIEETTQLNKSFFESEVEIPSEIGNLTNLTSLLLYGESLTGDIPSEIGNLTNLTFLSLSADLLTGEIPSSIGNLTNLVNLYINEGEIDGEIPSEIGNLTNLTYLSLEDNQLTGEIPSSIGNLTNLVNLHLKNNQLTGEIPSSIGNLASLHLLYLEYNQFMGIIPDEICNLDINWSRNNHYNFSNNKFCPPYPDCLTEEDIGEQDTSECSIGCPDPEACNYDETANVDDGSCDYTEENFDCDGNCIDIDYDGDGICDFLDDDDDNDGSLDDDDSAPHNQYQCSDHDGDTCDDCSQGIYNPNGDGWDYDGDGICDAGDGDDDDDGALDDDDWADNNEHVCSDHDGDTCDDCVNEWYDPSNDGFDYDNDGLCDDGDSDDDNDGSADDDDWDDNDENSCSDDDGDTCDDCSSGTHNIASDGTDTDSDGICDADDYDDDNDGCYDGVDDAPFEWDDDYDSDGTPDDCDGDDDNDGVSDGDDSDGNNEFVCSDDDGDTCDDCSFGSYDTFNDGLDTNSDGFCNAGDPTPYGEVSLSFSNDYGESHETHIDILYSSADDAAEIGGFQFQVNGVNLTGVSDGIFDVVNFNPANGMVVGFSSTGANHPNGSGTLIHLDFEAVDGGSLISLGAIQFSDENGNMMEVSSEDHNIPACWNYDGDSLSDGYYPESGNGGCDLYDPDDDNDGCLDNDDSDDNNEFVGCDGDCNSSYLCPDDSYECNWDDCVEDSGTYSIAFGEISEGGDFLCTSVGYWEGYYHLDEDSWYTFNINTPPENYESSLPAETYCCSLQFPSEEEACPDNGAPPQYQDQPHHATLSVHSLTITGNEPHPYGDYNLFNCNCGPPYPLFGCTDPTVPNYDPDATVDDGSCDSLLTCTDPYATNYNEPTGCIYPDNGDYSLEFDGVDDWVTINSANELHLSTGTITFWVIPEVISSHSMFIRKQGEYFIGMYGSKFYVGINNNSHLTEDIIIYSDVELEYWSSYFIAVVYEYHSAENNYKLKLYIDGQIQSEIGTSDSLIYNSTEPMSMGVSIEPTNYHQYYSYSGMLDEVIFWNIAMDEEQVNYYFANEQSYSNNDNVQVYYKFNAGQDSILYDHSGNGNHGTIHGAEWVCQEYDTCGVCGGDNSSCPTVTDVDGNVYKTVVIGEQLWMTENLKTTHYNNGESIEYYNFFNDDIYDIDYIGSYINGNEYLSYNTQDDYYYNSVAVKDNRNICPEDWHTPTVQEYMQLLEFIDAEANVDSSLGTKSDIAGGLLKSNIFNGSDSFGFSANCNGYFDVWSGGIWDGTNTSGLFWSQTEGYYIHIYSDDNRLDLGNNTQWYNHLSVRCLADEDYCFDDDEAVSPIGCEAAVVAFGCDYNWGGSLLSELCPETCGLCEDEGSEVSLSIEMAVGWNMFSINVIADDMSPDNVLASLSPSLNDQIKNPNGSAVYYGEEYGWVGSLSAIDVTSMYMINISPSGILEFTGTPVDPSTTPISLAPGWNWISYLPQGILAVNDALATVEGTINDQIKNPGGSAVYYGEEYGWVGSLASMSPGQGFMLKVAVESDLVYPSADGLVRTILNLEEPEVLPSTISSWDVNPHAYEFTGTIDFSIDDRDDHDGDYIGVFVGDECRGIGKRMYFPIDGSYYYSVMVFSNVTEGETLTFKYYSSLIDEIVEYTESVDFTANMIVGNGLSTFSLSREYIIPTTFSLDAAYPNPFNPVTTLGFSIPIETEVSISVYNLQGRQVASLVDGKMAAGYHSVVWNADSHSSGMYFVKMIAGEYISSEKLLLIK